MKVNAKVIIDVNSGATYLLFVLCAVGYALIKGATFEAFGTTMFGALVWYTGRRAYKEVKLAGMELTRGGVAAGDGGDK
jgi:hypothetical protein